MKNAIVDWNDEQAHTILDNCRRAVPSDGVLLLVEPIVPDDNRPSWSKIVDLPMLVLTGGKTRTVDEHRELLAGAQPSRPCCRRLEHHRGPANLALQASRPKSQKRSLGTRQMGFSSSPGQNGAQDIPLRCIVSARWKAGVE